MWLENCAADLDYHLRRVQVPGDGGRRRLNTVIGEIASTPLDRDRPLWEFHFVEGLEGNRVAVVGKVHHSLADGVASANLMARAMDYQPGQPEPEVLPDPIPTSRELITAAVRDHLGQIGQVTGLLGYTAKGVTNVVRRSGSAGGIHRSPAG
jgi:diacylglycerol O-acyltransferase / wax synthase